MRCIVCVADTHGYPHPLCLLKGIQPQFGHMRVQDAVLRMLGKEHTDRPTIRPRRPGTNRHHAEDAPAQRFDLVLIGATFLPVYQKVKLHARAVDMAVIVHDHGLGAATIQNGEKIENAYRVLPVHIRHPAFRSI